MLDDPIGSTSNRIKRPPSIAEGPPVCGSAKQTAFETHDLRPQEIPLVGELLSSGGGLRKTGLLEE
jgi:hypothetical protein